MGQFTEFLISLGYTGLFAVVFAESGLLIGFFFPGDSLLFTAGLLASQGTLNITVVVVGSVIAAVAGDSVGYAFGRRIGPRLFQREDSRFFKHSHLERAHAFYERHGGKTLILARFIPVVRTFAPIVAGIGQMKYRAFLSYNVVGGLLWAVGLPVLGFQLGERIPNIDRYIFPILAVIVVVSVLPPMWHVWRERRAQKKTGS